MFRRAARLREFIEEVVPNSAAVEVEGDLPGSFELVAEGDGVAVAAPFFETEGCMRETPSGFESTGELTLERRRPDELHELRLLDDGVLEGSHILPADSRLAAFVSTEDAVCSTVRSLLGTVSDRLGAGVDVETQGHSAGRSERGGTPVVEAEYVARLDGLDAVGRSDRGTFSVDEAFVSVSQGDETVSRWGFDVRNHGRIFTEESGDGRPDADEIQEARRRSDFAQNLDWSVRSARDGVSAEVAYTSKNAPRYTDELHRRGVPTPSHISLSFDLDTGDGGTSMSLDFETDGDPPPIDPVKSWGAFVPLPLTPLLPYIS